MQKNISLSARLGLHLTKTQLMIGYIANEGAEAFEWEFLEDFYN